MSRPLVTSIVFVLFCTLSLSAQTTTPQERLDPTEDDIMETDPLWGGPNVIDVFPMGPGQLPSIVQAEEYVPDRNELVNDEPTDSTGPMAGSNYIRMYICSTPSSSGSNADYIYMDFGPNDNLRLWGYSGTSFPVGYTLTWDLNQSGVKEWLEDDVSQEAWDYITLRTVSSDGIKISRLIIVHSSQEVLDWSYNGWLDSPNDSHLGLAAKDLERKMEYYPDCAQAAVNFGLRELGKTNGYKYGSGSLWCSEFASWCLRRDGWGTPTGSIGTDDMRSFFSARGRLYTQNQILNGTYTPFEGDYLSLWNGGHSAIFVEWIDDPNYMSTSTRFRTVEGNCGNAVRRATRSVSDIDHVGKSR